MYKLEFELKQHTPIIHFQATDDGATLRASEVKPKLDRFILTEIGKEQAQNSNLTKNDPYERGKEYLKKEDQKARELHKKTKKPLELYLIPGQEGALNYKLSFSSVRNSHHEYTLCLAKKPKKEQLHTVRSMAKEELSINLNILYKTAYFANDDKIKFENGQTPDLSKVHLGLPARAKIIGKVLIHHKGLIEQFKDYIEPFFLLHNFGSRQTKGFGSYTVKKITIPHPYGTSKNDIYSKYNTLKELKAFFKGKAILLKPEKGNKGRTSTLSPLQAIQKTHHKLRNNSLKQHFEKEDIEIEKDFVKQVAEGVILTNEDRERYRFSRALLGLPNQFEFPDNEAPKSKRVIVKHIETNVDKIIERYTSPLLYKPIDENIFVIISETPQELLGAKFSFRAVESEEETAQILSTPSSFALKEFLLYENKYLFEDL